MHAAAIELQEFDRPYGTMFLREYIGRFLALFGIAT
jgi:hypothetical protein